MSKEILFFVIKINFYFVKKFIEKKFAFYLKKINKKK